MKPVGYPYLAAVAAGVLLLAGCGNGQDVEATERALERLQADLLERYDLERASASYDRSTGTAQTDLISVQGNATTDDETAILDMVREITRETWFSDVPEITRITVRIRPQDGGSRYDTGDVFGSLTVPAATLEERFGSRS